MIKGQHVADFGESEDDAAVVVVGAAVQDVVEKRSDGAADVVAVDVSVLELATLQIIVTWK